MWYVLVNVGALAYTMEEIIIKSELPISVLHDSGSNPEEFNYNIVKGNLIKKEEIYIAPEPIPTQERTTLPAFQFACDCCDNIFDDFIKLFKHRQTCNSFDSEKVTNKNFTKWCLYCPLQFDYIIFNDGYLNIQKNTPELEASCDFCKKNVTMKRVFHHECHLCNISFAKCEQLSHHLRKVHKTNKPFRCVICGSVFSSGSLLRTHIRNHTGEKPYPCDICSKKFTTAYYVKMHQKVHTGERPYVCEYCNHKFRYSQNLKMHKLTHTAPAVCKICGKTYCTAASLRYHLDNVHSSDKSNRNFQFNCEFCPRILKSKESLKYHRYTHTGEKVFKCSVCQKKFIYPHKLRDHMKLHSSKNTFNCNLCPKKFITEYTLKLHIQYHKDSLEKRFKCDQCPKKYVNKCRLETHKYCHEKQFKCDKCLETYKTKQDLKNHLDTHSRESNETKLLYKCGLCPKTYVNKHTLKNHEFSHTGQVYEKNFKCDQCPKSYVRKKGLRYHQKTHIEETQNKRFKCDQCPKSYKQMLSLKRHKHSHAEVKT